MPKKSKKNKKRMPILVDLDSPSKMELILVNKNTMKVKQMHCDGYIVGSINLKEVTEDKFMYSSKSSANLNLTELGGCISITFANIVETIVSDFRRNHLEENQGECITAEKCVRIFEEIEKLLKSVAETDEEGMKH